MEPVTVLIGIGLLLCGICALGIFKCLGVSGVVLFFSLSTVTLLLTLKFSKGFVKQAISRAYRARGVALKNARIELVDVEVLPNPQTILVDDLPGNSAAPCQDQVMYAVELLVHVDSPQVVNLNNDEQRYWEPREIRLLDEEALLKEQDLIPQQFSRQRNEYEIHSIQIWREPGWAKDEEYLYAGSQKLRLQICVPLGTQRISVAYFYENLGAISLSPEESTISHCATRAYEELPLQ